MRTTLDIDADILNAAKVLAEAEHKTMGQVLSELVRKELAEAIESHSGEVDYTCEAEAGRSAGDQKDAVMGRRRTGGS